MLPDPTARPYERVQVPLNFGYEGRQGGNINEARSVISPFGSLQPPFNNPVDAGLQGDVAEGDGCLKPPGLIARVDAGPHGDVEKGDGCLKPPGLIARVNAGLHGGVVEEGDGCLKPPGRKANLQLYS
jgi:hypothetical protein